MRKKCKWKSPCGPVLCGLTFDALFAWATVHAFYFYFCSCVCMRKYSLSSLHCKYSNIQYMMNVIAIHLWEHLQTVAVTYRDYCERTENSGALLWKMPNVFVQNVYSLNLLYFIAICTIWLCPFSINTPKSLICNYLQKWRKI